MVCWFCRKTGTGTTVARGVGLGNTTPSRINVDVTGMTNPIVAIRMNGYTVARAGSYGIFATDAPIGTSYTYYIFDYSVSLPASSDYGIEIYNSAGQITFNSNYFPMQVLNMLEGNSNSNITNTVTHTGKLLAIANSSMGGYATRGEVYCSDSGAPQFWDGYYCDNLVAINDAKLYGGQLSNSSQTVTTANVSYDDVTLTLGNSNNYSVPPDWNTTSKLLVFDVTNIPVGQTFY